ncbi:O-antigen ligase family protein [Vibrio metoecus]|uniref:O-antigen ligase family protein n=1 Tax=Vibrio metoecus TaxID=1481663 RepID=UPI000BA98BF5|nr:O-antigen ligase family protein [Vibrio metoecus]
MISTDKNLFLYISVFLLLSPLSITLTELAGKPVDLVLSDLLLLLVPLIFFTNGFKSKYTVLVPVLMICFYLSLSAYNAILEGGQLSNFISSLRFTKQFILIAAGGAFFLIFGKVEIEVFFKVVMAILIIILASDLLFGSFPRGCGYEGRWGGCFILREVYGFPNSSASYLSILFLGVLFLHSINVMSAKKTIAVFTFVAVLSMLSLSRTAWLTIALGCFGFLLTLRKPILIIVYLSLSLLLCFIIFYNIEDIVSLPIFEGVINKVSYYASGNELTSGRTDIWLDAMVLWAERPLFGYGFDYFSNYVPGFDTPHQQYLELLFKSGLVGFSLYFFLLFVALFFFKDFLCEVRGLKSRHVMFRLVFILVFPILVNGIFQPILSYSIISNIVMFIFGYVLEFNRSNYLEGYNETSAPRYG